MNIEITLDLSGAEKICGANISDNSRFFIHSHIARHYEITVQLSVVDYHSLCSY